MMRCLGRISAREFEFKRRMYAKDKEKDSTLLRTVPDQIAIKLTANCKG